MPTDEQVLFQLTSGLDYIHSKDITHRNIRPENILIMTASSEWVQMKISNFNDKSEESIYWVPPIKKTPSGYWERIAPKFLYVHCDTFSCGCVLLYFLLRGIHPFGSINLVIPTNIARANPVNLKGITQSQYLYLTIL
jgi:serine/threonine protein kinase